MTSPNQAPIRELKLDFQHQTCLPVFANNVHTDLRLADAIFAIEFLAKIVKKSSPFPPFIFSPKSNGENGDDPQRSFNN